MQIRELLSSLKGLNLGGEMANLIMCTGGIQATCNQLRQKLKANENWDKHQTLKDIKGHTLVNFHHFQRHQNYSYYMVK